MTSYIHNGVPKKKEFGFVIFGALFRLKYLYLYKKPDVKLQCRRKQICIGGGGLNYGFKSGSNEQARTTCEVIEH